MVFGLSRKGCEKEKRKPRIRYKWVIWLPPRRETSCASWCTAAFSFTNALTAYTPSTVFGVWLELWTGTGHFERCEQRTPLYSPLFVYVLDVFRLLVWVRTCWNGMRVKVSSSESMYNTTLAGCDTVLTILYHILILHSYSQYDQHHTRTSFC